MIIKTTEKIVKKNRMMTSMLYILMVLVGIYTKEYMMVAFATIIWLPVVLIYDAVIGRTFVFDEHGCTVKIHNYKKTYTWDELLEKRLETGVMARSGKYEGVLFSPHPVKKPKKINFLDYALMHPLTAIFIFFESENSLNQFDYYSVDKKIFMQKMEEWGVELKHM